MSLATSTLRWILATTIPVPLSAQDAPRRPDSASVALTAYAFLVAFDSLRWGPFEAAWGQNPSVFLPDSDTPRLVVGRAEVLRYFRTLFDDVGADSTAGPPSLQILSAVRDLRISLTGPGAALVTFELGDGKQPGRRTLVWTWDSGRQRWLLIHLHASRLTPS